ncbi:unnamed protein product [Merluccius merluccius]
MSDFIILLLILILAVCLIATLVGFVLYSGLLSEVVIGTGSPPIRNVTIAYKFREGSYKECGAGYTESCSIGPQLSSIGIFYDDPKQRPAEQCRYAVGSVLSEGEQAPDPELQKLYEKHGFTVFSLPEVTHAVTSSFPSTTPLSHILGPYRVYPQLSSYIEARKLSAFPTIEVCKDDQTHYMVPLSRQTDFFVPEMRDEVKTELREDESDEDRGTDITGADSHSDVSSVSGGVPWDSREMPLVASLASALPLRDLADGEEHPGPRLSDRDSDKSVGSGSSFEELDMEQVECPEEEEEDEIKEKEAEVGGGEGGGAAARGGVEKQEKEDGVGSKGAVESMAEEERREPSGDGEE